MTGLAARALLALTSASYASAAVFPRGFLYSDFKATAGGRAKDVSWSSGTGDVGPVFFEVGGKKFVLELSRSEAFKGWLKDDELVLWREADFRRNKKT